MKTRNLTLLALLLSALLSAVGAWMICRSFSDSLGNAAEQAAAQQAAVVYALNLAAADDGVTVSSGYIVPVDSPSGERYRRVSAEEQRVTRYMARQNGMLGAEQFFTALVCGDGTIPQSSLPAAITEEEIFAAVQDGAEGMRLAGRCLLLANPLRTRTELWAVTAMDLSGLYAARDAQLSRWLALQAVLLLAALFGVWHYARLRALNERQARFVAALTHELKTPMTAVMGYADLLRSGELSEERRCRAANTLYHESARLEALSQRLLSLQKLQNAPPLALEPVPVAAAFAEAARSLPDLPVTLETDVPAGAGVLADRVLLGDLLRNLILNAAQASEAGAAVRLGCTRAGDRWRLTVTDEGRGIPPEALPHVKEPFYRVDKARARADGGSGLGLTLCDEIARAFGGSLTLASEPGRGTTAALELKGVLPDENKA